MSSSYRVPLFDRLQELIDEYKLLRRESDVDTIVEAIERIEELEDEIAFVRQLKDTWRDYDEDYPVEY
jgi:hypothetical protein